MRPRLASSILINSLIRLAETHGGFGAVLARGDATAGSILLILRERGQPAGTMERVLQPDGDYAWQLVSSQAIEKDTENDGLVERRRKFDPDLWVLELDIPSQERFAAEMTELN